MGWKAERRGAVDRPEVAIFKGVYKDYYKGYYKDLGAKINTNTILGVP